VIVNFSLGNFLATPKSISDLGMFKESADTVFTAKKIALANRNLSKRIIFLMG
jgi:hypothetical protein